MISEFPLFAFTTLTGIAAGALLASVVNPQAKNAENGKAWLFPLVMLVLVGVGALASVTHLGRPANMLYMLGNPTSSLVLEGIFAGLTGLAVLIDLILCAKGNGKPAVRIIAAVLGIVLMIVQGYAYATSYGNPAWCALSVWPFFVLGSLGAGYGVWALFADCAENKRFALSSAVLLVVAAVAYAWEATTFSAAAADAALLICGAVFAVVAAVLEFVAASGKGKMLFVVGIVVGIVALAVARYGFYMASII